MISLFMVLFRAQEGVFFRTSLISISVYNFIEKFYGGKSRCPVIIRFRKETLSVSKAHKCKAAELR